MGKDPRRRLRSHAPTWLAMLARRRESARLLVVGSYRAVDLIMAGHPLRALIQDLQVRRQCEDIAVPFLREAHVGAYLAQRFGGHAFQPGLARAVHQRTDGNPLFMVRVAARRRDRVTARASPASPSCAGMIGNPRACVPWGDDSASGRNRRGNGSQIAVRRRLKHAAARPPIRPGSERTQPRNEPNLSRNPSGVRAVRVRRLAG